MRANGPKADQDDDQGKEPPGAAADVQVVEQQRQPDGDHDQSNKHLPGIAPHGSTSTRAAALDGSTTSIGDVPRPVHTGKARA